MDVLVLGSGAREHALAWRLARDEGVRSVRTAPGNGGTAAVGENVDLDPTPGVVQPFTGACEAPLAVSTADGASLLPPPAVHAAVTSTNVVMAMSHRFMFVSLLWDRDHGP